jgi:ketosteroid isomerase-like protein
VRAIAADLALAQAQDVLFMFRPSGAGRAIMSDAHAIAADFTAMLNAGQFVEAGEKYWAPDVRSVEAMDMSGMGAVSDGIDAVRAKGEWWYANHEVHVFAAEGPYVNGDQFVLRFTMDVLNKQSGQRVNGLEMGLYTLRDGKIVEERFFYG